MLRLTAERADFWNPSDGDLDAAVKAGRQLRRLCEEAGRSPNAVGWSTQLQFDGRGVDAVVREGEKWRAEGFTELVVYLSGDDPVAAATVAAESILPALR